MLKRITNILLTGKKKCGKTTLLKSILSELNEDYEGFYTSVKDEYELGNTYNIIDFKSGERMPISRFDGSGFMPVQSTFDSFGRDIVKTAVNSECKLLVFDEIGRFERNSTAFLNELTKALNCEKTVIAVLKKEDLAHINEYKKREDSFVFDIEECECTEKLKEKIIGIIENNVKKEKDFGDT